MALFFTPKFPKEDFKFYMLLYKGAVGKVLKMRILYIVSFV
jgi:hypothetical protein